MLCEEWRMCRSGDGLAAVLLRRIRMPKYDIRRLDMDDCCEDEMIR
jgi:hypothetical protein